jgi:hypothetical protein
MKPHEPKRYKTRAKKKEKTKGDKKTKSKNLTKDNKRNEPKIKILTHELLASTLSYLMLAPW